MDSLFNLTGKSYIVTGASSGIGKETCKCLTKLGATVYMIARNEERLKDVLISLSGDNNKYYVYDLNDVDGIEDLIKQIVFENGKLDGLVHSAGVGFSRPLKNSKYDFVQDILRVNFNSFVELTRVISLKKYNNGFGSIVGISSISSINGSKALSAYSASKSAMDSFVRVAAKELIEKNIRVNTVQPCWVKTDMMQEYIEDVAGNSEEALNKTEYAIEPDEVANVIAFLLSNASSGINGTSIPIMGKQV